jgi:hypothetical protein
MSSPTKYKRSVEVIMQADFVRLIDEAPIRYPFTYPVLHKKKKEGRIRTYGSPETIHCPEFEKAMKAGFPVIETQTGEAA